MPETKQKEDFNYIVRIAEVDLDGNRSVGYAMTKIKGIGARVAGAIADNAKIDRCRKIGTLNEEEIERLNEVIKNLPKYVPIWMLNRQCDISTGGNVHLTGYDMDMAIKEDINLMKKIRCYKGIRHETGQRVRGQRTRAHGRTGLTVGVTRKVLMEAAKKKKGEEKKGGRKEEKKGEETKK
ncbi:MAG: 30S ribosomal protein S13 [Candidatus Thermoplasmatota archaeon]|nr:30S ribosomal protein S13 [Candidatus Thermoplasmatota archaeon]MBU4189649.1 30S ribosomal protein S13 [Candidatus Thermoplasmatota archaeon]MBU4256728.1 30S ribosomal protein S13 [Candidatus Thermoplasmatota archaeon]MCG2826070.1 30S ribosomal protein S13 [Thermoplasmatales archaeon]